jgi:hypothetical protein
MKTSMVERRLRDADPARGLELDGVSEATSELRDAIAWTAVVEAGAFDTAEIVLTSDGANGSRLHRRHALVAAAAAVLLAGTVAGAVTVVADRSSDDGPDVATANSAVTTTVPSTGPSSVPPNTTLPSTGELPATSLPTGATLPGAGPGAGADTPGGGSPATTPGPRCLDFDRPYPGWELRTYLLQQAPNGFGGIYDGGTGALVVAYVPGHQDVVARAKAAFDETVCAQSPAIDYRAVSNSTARLELLMARLRDGGDIALHGLGVEVNSFAVDDSINRLRVGLAEVTPANEQAVLDELGAVAHEMQFEQADVAAPV